ncbi:MAG: DUF4250 domain-containing protein [Lachnospiraceae bacterium]|nr:DUF4250 domain-containing protein [Lachnospiraceae bacterium]
MQLPKDPVILLSYVNTQLRDKYPSLAALCDACDCTEESIVNTLQSMDYHYDSDTNQFI